MEFDRIFAPYLHAVRIDGVNVFNKIVTDWNNANYLFEYFSKKEQDLKYFNVSVPDAVRITRFEINKFRNNLQQILNSKNPNLDQLFSNLDNKEYRTDVELSQQKAKPNHKYWLRIYALKIESNRYVIVGGALKLKELMDEDEATKKELVMLNQVRDFLRNEGITDYDGFYELII
ncbi:MAG: hypothetical protein RL679_679 [Bacteroidota bacterium]|jgi:hypothetical protein